LAITGLPGTFGPPRYDAAEVRQPGSPGHFKSGGERSAAILTEIAATLEKMDGRVERIEKAVIELNERDKRRGR
jgi:hypothetical protein